MSKKHFIKLAAALRDNKPDPTSAACQEVALFSAIVRDVASACAAINPRFNRATFDRAAGVAENMKGGSGYEARSQRCSHPYRVHNASAYGNRFMFTGREWFPELNVYDYRNRLYNPDNGRFLQVDPTGFDGGDMNLFRYTADDPVDLTDPNGLVATEANNNRIMSDWWWRFACIGDSGNSFQGGLTEFFQDRWPAGTDGGSGGSQGGGERRGPGGMQVAYLVYSGNWTEKDAKDFQQLWRENEKTLNDLASDNVAHIVTPDHAGGGFNIVPSFRRESRWDQLKNWFTGASAPASERFARDIRKQINKDISEKAGREFHDMKEAGGPNRTKAQLKEDARAVYENWNKTPPRWLQD
jgi:RHS repeat-associated protein